MKLTALLAALALLAPPAPAQAPSRPNILFILADDLGYGDLSCYGQKLVQTPNIDALAAQGLKFTHAYAGATVCAPSRCSLMTGLHGGHMRIRGNKDVPLRPEDLTVAELLKSAGYSTALIGKWGLGEPGSTGTPNKKGFDLFYGYTNQTHAHNSYPEYLWRNEEKVALPNKLPAGAVTRHGEGVSEVKAQFSNDLFVEEALKYLQAQKGAGKPFFLYFATTAPHANNEGKKNGIEVPESYVAPFAGKDWPENEKRKAGLISHLDASVGRLMAALKEYGLEENTLVLFSSDNGPHKEGGSDPAFFTASGPLRGIKRDLYDGGIRVPFIARWPGRIAPGTTTDFVTAFWDFMPTAAELAGATDKLPKELDGVSIVPTLLGKEQKPHDYLYFEFHERGFTQAVRMGNWKGVRLGMKKPVELYDVVADPGEATDLAGKHPHVAKRIEEILAKARVDSADFPINEGPRKQPAKK